MRSDLKTLNDVCQSTRDTVFGYIRECQKLLNEDRIIAPLIYHLCLLFFHIKEYWTAFHGGIFEVNEKMDTFTKFWHGRGTVYGNICIDSEIECVYKWKFKILENKNWFGVYFGIDSSNKKFLDRDYRDWTAENKSKHYAYGDQKIFTNHKMSRYGDQTLKGFMNVETVQIELNTKDRTIKYIVDDIDQGIAFKNIDITLKYHLAISTYRRYLSIKILSFEQNVFS